MRNKKPLRDIGDYILKWKQWLVSGDAIAEEEDDGRDRNSDKSQKAYVEEKKWMPKVLGRLANCLTTNFLTGSVACGLIVSELPNWIIL